MGRFALAKDRQPPRTVVLAGILLGTWGHAPQLMGTDLAPGGEVVISEISYNPPSRLGRDASFEFVEIHTRGDEAVDVSDWRLRVRGGDSDFVIPAGTLLPAGGHLVLARNAAALRQVLGGEVVVVGDFPFALGNGGDVVSLLDGDGHLIDQVTYDDDFPWPLEADGDGATLERIQLRDDVTDFSNFAASKTTDTGTPGAPNSQAGEIPERHHIVLNEIMYHPVQDPDADPLRHCASDEYVELLNRGTSAVDLGGWELADGVRYTFPVGTTLAPGSYLVIFKDEASFRGAYGAEVPALGPYELELDNGGELLALLDADGQVADAVDFDDTPPWPVNPDGISGSLELVDPTADNERAGAWRESRDFGGSPGRKNSAAKEAEGNGGSGGAHITALVAFPSAKPKGGGDPDGTEIRSTDAVEVEVRVTGRAGVGNVTLEYQAMAPGQYIRRTDPAFETDWLPIEMSFDLGCGKYVGTIPPFPHRTLVRYRVRATDNSAAHVETFSPRQRDPEPNQAYFVYDGVPDYVANRRSAFGPPGFAHSNLTKVPVYFIIGHPEDIQAVQYDVFHDKIYRWSVTFVHENHVYDHCGVRLRGGGTRYGSPKRNWKVRFNKGNRFRGRFNDGTLFPRGRSKINLMRGGLQRGESGVIETLGWRLYREAGVLGGKTTFAHLRVVRSTEELDQFDGDFFGIFLEVQAVDTVLLRDFERPVDEDSSLYRFDAGVEKKHPDCDAFQDDLDRFNEERRTVGTREWFAANLEVERYLSFTAVKDLIDDDKDNQFNYLYYRSSATGKFEVIPWDLDRAFGIGPSGEEPLRTAVTNLFPLEFRNRFRFLWQTLYATARLDGLLDDMTSLIQELADADLDRWDTEPTEACRDCTGAPEEVFLSYRPLATRVRAIKGWSRQRRAVLAGRFQDDAIPLPPENLFPFASASTTVPLTLWASAFVDPNPDDAHAESRWLLIAEDGDWVYPLWELVSATDLVEVGVPGGVVEPGGRYLFRVAHKDATGRWGLLSEPTPFAVVASNSPPPSPPEELRAVSVAARSVVLRWEAPEEADNEELRYRVLRDGSALPGAPVSNPEFGDPQPEPGGRHNYQVVSVNRSGRESAPSLAIEVEIPVAVSLSGWAPPLDGFDYFYDALPGEDRYTDPRVYREPSRLDGSWEGSQLDDWDGSRPGEEGSSAGGVGVEVVIEVPVAATSVLTVEDSGAPAGGISPPQNGRLLSLRPLGDRNPFANGVTLVARLRVNPSPRDLTAPTSQAQGSLRRGQIGIGHRVRPARGYFSFWLDENQLLTNAGPSIPVDVTTFQAVWITIAPEADAYRLRVYHDGAETAAIDETVTIPTTGLETGFDGTYLEIALANRDETGSIQVDYLGYKAGAHAPLSAPSGSPGEFIRGDANADGSVDLGDGLAVLGYVFRRENVECLDAADANDNGRVNVADALLVLRHILSGTAVPSPPFPNCGTDATDDRFQGCVRSCR